MEIQTSQSGITTPNRSKARFACRGGGLRSSRGSGLLEGIAGMILISTLVGLAAMLLLNVGMFTYYQGKLGVLTNSAAAYAASIISNNNSANARMTDDFVGRQTAKMVNMALAKMKLPANARVTARRHDTKVSVTVTLINLSLAGDGNIIPLTISLADSACAELNHDEPPMLLQINGNGNVFGFYHFGTPPARKIACVVPAYGKLSEEEIRRLAPATVYSAAMHRAEYRDISMARP